MASVQSQWEVVGARKPKYVSQSSKKTNVKGPTDYVHFEQQNAQITPTIYDAFNNDIKKKQEKPTAKDSPKPTRDSTLSKKPISKKKQPDKKNPPQISLQEGLKLVSGSELESLLVNEQATFPDAPTIWLKDLASYINLKLDNVKEADPVFDGKPRDYPLCELHDTIKKIMRRTMKVANKAVLELFFEHCIQSVIMDMGKGMPTYGYRMFIQLLANDHPTIALNNLEKSLEMIKANQNRPLRCLSIMWSVGQSGLKDLSAGLRVWLDVMLPVLGVRALSVYAVSYLDQLLSHYKDRSKDCTAVSFRDFFPVLDIIHSGTSTLPSQSQKKLLLLYPKIKDIALGNKPESTLRTFFPSFLARLRLDGYSPFREELLDCLVICLVKDKHCFSLWRQMYTKHMIQSRILLDYILRKWDFVIVKMDKKLLRETVCAFDVTNDELTTQQKLLQEGSKECSLICKEILVKKFSGFSFPWRLLFWSVLGILVGLLAFDIISHNGFKESRTSKTIEDMGVKTFIVEAAAKVKLHSYKVNNWLSMHVPVYYNYAVEISKPYLSLMCTKLSLLIEVIKETSQPLIDWCYTKTPELQAWVNTNCPNVFDKISSFIVMGWGVFLHYGFLAWEFVVFYSNLAGTWLLENVLVGTLSPENLQQLLSKTLVTIQDNLSTFILWCNNMISQKTS